MKYTTGKSKPLHEISIEDYFKYPIWVTALDEETLPGQDETWQKPILDTTNVTPDMVMVFIALRIKGTNLRATSDYDCEADEISVICVWYEGKWVTLAEIPTLKPPVTIVAVPSINGESDVEFVVENFKRDEGVRKSK